jgi:hypothetical protein
MAPSFIFEKGDRSDNSRPTGYRGNCPLDVHRKPKKRSPRDIVVDDARRHHSNYPFAGMFVQENQN